jgi:two-component system, NarL family, sensor histidine kinase UhpB
MSLRRRILAIIALLLAASLAVGGVLTYLHGTRKIDLEMSSAIAVADNALREAVAPMLTGPISDLQLARIIASFDGDRHVQARVVSTDGSTRFVSHVRQPQDPAPGWLFRLLTSGTPDSTELKLPADTGRIILQGDALNEVTEVWDDAKEKLAIVGGFCALALGMISATLGRALRPLETLSQALRQVGGGDYGAHVAEKGPHELAEIYKGFNTMAARLSNSEQQNKRLAGQLSTLQDEERAEIARDLHDEVGPFLFAVDVDAQTIPALLARNATDDVAARSRAIRQSVAHMQTHVRSVLSRLRPGMLLDLGLCHAAEQLAAFWRERYPAIAFDVDCSDASFGATLDEAAFRVLQEGASNAIRHGKPSKICLSARKSNDGAVVVSVVDDGEGLVETARKGFGLAGMRERIALLGGTLSISPGTGGKGVCVRAVIPLQQTKATSANLQSETIPTQ